MTIPSNTSTLHSSLRWPTRWWCARVRILLVLLMGWSFASLSPSWAQTNQPPPPEPPETSEPVPVPPPDEETPAVEPFRPPTPLELNPTGQVETASPDGAGHSVAGEMEKAPSEPQETQPTPARDPVRTASMERSRPERRERDGQESKSSPGSGQESTNSGSTDRHIAEGPSAAPQDFSAFQLISERNIFDPNRSPRRANNNRPRPKTVERITLVGIMKYEKGAFAFFDGSSSAYKKALKPGDTAGGLKVTAIEDQIVKLASGEQDYSLKVGSQLRREEEGAWTISNESAPTNAASAPSTTAPAAASATAGAQDEVLKKLMERREKE